MATRQTLGSGSPGPITGPTYMDNVAAHIKRLYDAAGFPLTSVAGTANAVTATLDPVLDGSGLVTGMRFGITWGTTNTGAMTLAINGGSPVAVLDSAGVAMVAGVAVAGTRALLEYVGGSFRVMTSGGGAGGVARYYQAFIRYLDQADRTGPEYHGHGRTVGRRRWGACGHVWRRRWGWALCDRRVQAGRSAILGYCDHRCRRHHQALPAARRPSAPC